MDDALWHYWCIPLALRVHQSAFWSPFNAETFSYLSFGRIVVKRFFYIHLEFHSLRGLYCSVVLTWSSDYCSRISVDVLVLDCRRCTKILHGRCLSPNWYWGDSQKISWESCCRKNTRRYHQTSCHL